jgi:hypothetical protein
MRRIGLAIILSLTLTPLAVTRQHAGKVPRMGFSSRASRTSVAAMVVTTTCLGVKTANLTAMSSVVDSKGGTK